MRVRHLDNSSHQYILNIQRSKPAFKELAVPLYFLMEAYLQQMKLIEIRANFSEKF